MNESQGLNGVPAFGPQESEGTNAVETASGGEGFAGFWCKLVHVLDYY